MSKRQVILCDLTKSEIVDDNEIVTITIKKSGKGRARSYDLSASAAAKLESQLVAGREALLPENWSFGSNASKENKSDGSKLTLGDLDDDNMEKSIAEKRALITPREPEEVVEEPVFEFDDKTNNDCRHLNKGPIQTTLKNKKRFIYRSCKTCKQKIPEMTADQRKQYMSGNVNGEDIRIGSKNK